MNCESCVWNKNRLTGVPFCIFPNCIYKKRGDDGCGKNELMEQAKALYLGGKAPSEIAELLGVSPGTVRSWKSRGGWGDNAATQRNVAKERCNATDTNTKLIQSVEENPELTDQQRVFCLHYVKTFHATNSAIRAGYSSETAGQIGYQLLQKIQSAPKSPG